jgi:hypothetical protein
MTQVNVTKSNKEFDNIYKELFDELSYIGFDKHVYINNDSFFSRFMFLKSIQSIMNIVDFEDLKKMEVYECHITDMMSLYSVEKTNDYIYESYRTHVRTNIGNFSQKIIPQHSLNSPIKNDELFIKMMYERMELDPDFQNISTIHNGNRDYPIRHVQVDVLVAMYRYLGKHNRADFLYICRELYDMVKDLKYYSDVRVKKVSRRNRMDISLYNPIMLLERCDSIDRLIVNEESGNTYIIGCSTNFKDGRPNNILKNMKQI